MPRSQKHDWRWYSRIPCSMTNNNNNNSSSSSSSSNSLGITYRSTVLWDSTLRRGKRNNTLERLNRVRNRATTISKMKGSPCWNILRISLWIIQQSILLRPKYIVVFESNRQNEAWIEWEKMLCVSTILKWVRHSLGVFKSSSRSRPF